MDIGSIIAWIIIGAIAGWLASMVMKTSGGFVTDVIVGIVGAFIGGFVLNLIPGVNAGVSGINLGSLLTAFIGAVILLAILKAFTRNSRTTVP